MRNKTFCSLSLWERARVRVYRLDDRLLLGRQEHASVFEHDPLVDHERDFPPAGAIQFLLGGLMNFGRQESDRLAAQEIRLHQSKRRIRRPLAGPTSRL